MIDLGDRKSGADINFKFYTHQADGTPITLAGTPTLAVYKSDGTTEITTGITLTVDFDSRTGCHHVKIATTDSSYLRDNDYEVVITTGTVDGVSVVGYVIATFSIEHRMQEREVFQEGAIDIRDTVSPASGLIYKAIGGTRQEYAVIYTADNSGTPKHYGAEILGSMVRNFDAASPAEGYPLVILGAYYQDGAGAISEIIGIASEMGVNATNDLSDASWTGAADETAGGAGWTFICTYTDDWTAGVSGDNLDIWYTQNAAAIGLVQSEISDLRHRLNIDGVQTTPTAGGVAKMAGTDADLTLKSLAVVQTASNADAISLTGNGTGNGLNAVGGADGNGIRGEGGASAGNGVLGISGASGLSGIRGIGVTTGAGIEGVGGSTGSGIKGTSGSSGGHGAQFTAAGAHNSNGILAQGSGNEAGFKAIGGDTGSGINAVGGSTSGEGFRAEGDGSGIGIHAIGTNGNDGLRGVGDVAGHGIHGFAGSAGTGLKGTGGSGGGHGASFEAVNTGVGLQVIGNDTEAGLHAIGGATAHGIHGQGGAASGSGIRANGVANGIGLDAVGAGGQAGIQGTGSGTGAGISGTASSTGVGIKAQGGSTGGHGMTISGAGSANGLAITAGSTGHAIALTAAGGKGIDGSGVFGDQWTEIYPEINTYLEVTASHGAGAWTTSSLSQPTLLQTTSIATLASQTSFTLAAGSSDDDAYNGSMVIVTNASTSTQKAIGIVADYTGSSKTVTLFRNPQIFTMAIGDTVEVIAGQNLRLQQTLEGTIAGKVNAIPGTSTTLLVKELTNDADADLNIANVLRNRVLTFTSGIAKGQSVGIVAQAASASDPITLTVTAMANFANIAADDEFVIT